MPVIANNLDQALDIVNELSRGREDPVSHTTRPGVRSVEMAQTLALIDIARSLRCLAGDDR